jgi:hypothetical protein
MLEALASERFRELKQQILELIVGHDVEAPATSNGASA